MCKIVGWGLDPFRSKATLKISPNWRKIAKFNPYSNEHQIWRIRAVTYLLQVLKEIVTEIANLDY